MRNWFDGPAITWQPEELFVAEAVQLACESGSGRGEIEEYLLEQLLDDEFDLTAEDRRSLVAEAMRGFDSLRSSAA